MDVKDSRFARNRLAWFALAVVMLAVPLLWIVSIYIVLKLYVTRDYEAMAIQNDLAAGNVWGARSQAAPGMACGNCGKPLSPVWKGKCHHCGTFYAQATPVPHPNRIVTA